MKRAERHRLKENELILAAGRARDVLARRRRLSTLTAAAAVVALVALGAWVAWRQHVNTKADELFAQAVAVGDAAVLPPAPAPDPATPEATPPPPPPPGSYPTEQAKLEAALPKFAAVADAYPSTASGIAARYREASLLARLGRPDEAAARYQDVIDRAGRSIYGDMARLGLAGVQVDAGQYDPAIAVYRELATDSDTHLPIDGVLLQLGRAYARAGKPDDAIRAYTRIVDEFPQSLYAAEAKREMETIKKG